MDKRDKVEGWNKGAQIIGFILNISWEAEGQIRQEQRVVSEKQKKSIKWMWKVIFHSLFKKTAGLDNSVSHIEDELDVKKIIQVILVFAGKSILVKKCLVALSFYSADASNNNNNNGISKGHQGLQLWGSTKAQHQDYDSLISISHQRWSIDFLPKSITVKKDVPRLSKSRTHPGAWWESMKEEKWKKSNNRSPARRRGDKRQESPMREQSKKDTREETRSLPSVWILNSSAE